MARWAGLDNDVTVFTDRYLLKIIGNAFILIIFFSFIPVGLGLLVATLVRRITGGPFGTTVRTILFLPQVIPLVAAGIAWSWLLSSTGLVNQVLRAVGLGGLARAWLGEFDTALTSVGVIGAWVLLGLCTILLITGMTKIDPAPVRGGPDRRRRPGPRVPRRDPAQPLFLWTWNQFLLAIVLVDDPTKRTMAGAFGAFQGQWGTDQVLLSARFATHPHADAHRVSDLPAPVRQGPTPRLSEGMSR